MCIKDLILEKYVEHLNSKVEKYYNIYHFSMEPNHTSHNNEADAFKHAFMQAQLALWGGEYIAKMLGDFHEFQGNTSMGQSLGEYNMDNWNNEQGREIAKEIIHEYGAISTILSQKINDIIMYFVKIVFCDTI